MDSDVNSGADHLVELIVREEPPSIVDDVPISEEIAPLLTQIEKPKINIFTISYPRRKPMVTFHTTYFFFNNFDQQFPPLFPILVAEITVGVADNGVSKAGELFGTKVLKYLTMVSKTVVHILERDRRGCPHLEYFPNLADSSTVASYLDVEVRDGGGACPEQVNKIHDSDVSSLSQSIIWIWSGSRYSGLLCASLSSIFYFGMEVLMGVFSAQSIPIIEMAFTRCVIITILSYLWLRRSEQPIFGQPHVRKLLVSRALTGLLSMMSFIYSIRRLHISQAIVLSFTTPILASVAARFILHEKLKFSDFGGTDYFLITFSFQFLLLYNCCIKLFEGLTKAGKGSTTPSLGSHHAYAVLLGFVASIAGAVSYCLIRASAKASDQPVVTVFSFGLLAGPVTGICTVIFEDLVLPSLYSFLLMLVLGLLAFLAEVCWARGLQLEKTSKVCNLRFMEASFVQLWHIGILGVVPFGRIVGTLLIFLSLCWTFYVGPDREME
ncbi:putative membrane protein isoform X1 [Cucumis melo var. makuwa]|uniref:Putative membrane protein isoform X1 n=1 Tax=Cucumis melo var. makuwa TaxID=1194695 RepID=A0A5D3C650_CUCMM|nr:putative membrane protein isoform X1 [Cucumis melo var. makuwa]